MLSYIFFSYRINLFPAFNVIYSMRQHYNTLARLADKMGSPAPLSLSL